MPILPRLNRGLHAAALPASGDCPIPRTCKAFYAEAIVRHGDVTCYRQTPCETNFRLLQANRCATRNSTNDRVRPVEDQADWVFSRKVQVLCPLPERARCVKGGLRGFCRLCVPACSSNAQTFHALRASGMLSWYVGLHGSFRCRLRSTFIDLLQCYDFICEVCSVVLFCMRPCLNPSLRGRPRTVGRVRARARSARHR